MHAFLCNKLNGYFEQTCFPFNGISSHFVKAKKCLSRLSLLAPFLLQLYSEFCLIFDTLHLFDFLLICVIYPESFLPTIFQKPRKSAYFQIIKLPIFASMCPSHIKNASSSIIWESQCYLPDAKHDRDATIMLQVDWSEFSYKIYL